MSKDAFQEEKEIYYQKIAHNKITHPEWAPFIENIFEKRNALYRNFYPKKLDVGKTDTYYNERLLIILKKQIAEYFVNGSLLTKDYHSFTLVSDSPIMSEIYSFNEKPILCGKDSTVIEYTE